MPSWAGAGAGGGIAPALAAVRAARPACPGLLRSRCRRAGPDMPCYGPRLRRDLSFGVFWVWVFLVLFFLISGFSEGAAPLLEDAVAGTGCSPLASGTLRDLVVQGSIVMPGLCWTGRFVPASRGGCALRVLRVLERTVNTPGSDLWRGKDGTYGFVSRAAEAAAASAAAFCRLGSRRQKVPSQAGVSHAFSRAVTDELDREHLIPHTLPRKKPILYVVVLCPKKTPEQFFCRALL